MEKKPKLTLADLEADDAPDMSAPYWVERFKHTKIQGGLASGRRKATAHPVAKKN